MNRIIAAALAWALFCYAAAAQNTLTAEAQTEVDRLITTDMAQAKVPGLALAIVQHGALVYAMGYGLADLENSVPVTADTVFRIASLSKPITATAAMKLVESGKLDVDARVQNYCPAFPVKPWPITTRELLAHQSGIRHYLNDAESINTVHFGSINHALRQPFAREPLLFEPGTKFSYTSYGYIVVGCAIEGAASMDYPAYMRQAIFEPAGMAVTRLDDVFAIIPHRARGYELEKDGRLRNTDFVDISNKPPGSGINSSARDLGKFLVALYAGKLVSPSTMARMMTGAKTRDGSPTIYGYGWFVGGPISQHNGAREVGHGGDVQGFSSIFYLMPDRQFGIAILTNVHAENLSLDYVKLCRDLYDALAAHAVPSAH